MSFNKTNIRNQTISRNDANKVVISFRDITFTNNKATFDKVWVARSNSEQKLPDMINENDGNTYYIYGIKL